MNVAADIDQEVTYTYDFARADVATTTYGYDAFGSRVLQTGTSTTFIYPSEFYSIASSTVSGAKYATTTEYVFNGDTLLSTVDQQTASGIATGTAQVRYIHPDHLGSTNVVTDQNGALVQTLDYYPYGATRISVSTSTNEKRKFIDQFSDDSGLSYLQARYYNSTQGQFISEDPVFWGDPKGQDLANPQNLNTYSYAIDNPITKKDPSGRIAGWDDALSFAAGGLINLGIYGVGSMADHQPLSWGGALGSFTAGGILGWAIDNAPETGGGSIAATLSAMKYAAKFGARAALVGDVIKQGIDVPSGAQAGGVNWGELAVSPVQGATTAALGEGALPDASIPWLSSGRGSFNAVRKMINTDFSNGLIRNVSISTAFKSAIGSQAAGAFKTAGGAAWDYGSSRIGGAAAPSVSTWMGAFNPFQPHK